MHAVHSAGDENQGSANICQALYQLGYTPFSKITFCNVHTSLKDNSLDFKYKLRDSN